LDNTNNSEDDCAPDDDCDIAHNYCIEDSECPQLKDVSATLMCTDCFIRHGSQRDRLKWFWWQLMHLKHGEIKEGRKSRTKWVNGSAALCSLTESFC
jgi:hypothetical protein